MKKWKIYLILAVFASFPIVVFAEEGAGILPTSSFYFLDNLGEWAKIHIFTWSKEGKVKLMIRYMEEKQKEFKKVLEEGKDIEESAEALAREGEYIEDTSEKINELKEKGRDVSFLVEKLQSNLNRQQENLKRVYGQVPDEAKEAIKKVMEKSGSGLENAIQMIQKEKGEIDEVGALHRRIKENIKMIRKEEGDDEEANEDEIEVEIEKNLAKVDVDTKTVEKEFILYTINKDQIIAEIVKRTGIPEDQVRSIIKFEENGLGADGKKEIEVEIEKGIAKVDVDAGAINKEFILYTTDRDQIINEIVKRTGISRDEVVRIMKIEIEDEEVEQGQKPGENKEDIEDEDNNENNRDNDETDDESEDD